MTFAPGSLLPSQTKIDVTAPEYSVAFRQTSDGSISTYPLWRKDAKTMRAATRTQADRELNDDDAPSGRDREPRRKTRRASRGQVIILFAGALIGLIGFLGLATDLGYAFAERRTMQNAADAGAIAGAHTLSKSIPGAPSVLGDVRNTAVANKMGSTNPTVTCQYVDDTDKELGDCSGTVPTTIPPPTGVHVTVKETHNTFFMRIVPGGPHSLSTSATAIAHVQQLKTPPGDGPFVVCGVTPKIDAGPRNVDIVIPTAAGWQLNPNAVTTDPTNPGPTFQVFGPNVSTCGLNPQNFKGQAVGTNNANLTAPDWFSYANGDAAGHVDVSVNGVDGCTPALIINCVAFLPVVVNNPPPNTTTNKMWAVMILPFYLTAASYSNGNLNKLDAQILGDYISLGNGKPGWIPGTQGPIVIKLTK